MILSSMTMWNGTWASCGPYDKWCTMNIQSKDMVFSMSLSQLSSISSRKVTQLTHCTSSIEAPAASDIDFDFNQTNL